MARARAKVKPGAGVAGSRLILRAVGDMIALAPTGQNQNRNASCPQIRPPLRPSVTALPG